MGAALPFIGLALGAIATMVAARLNSRPQERSAGLAELQAGLTEQRIRIDRLLAGADRDGARIDALEAEVAECEAGRAADREQASVALAELRTEVRTLRENQ